MQGYRPIQRANLARPGGTRSLLPQWFGSQPARRRQLLRPALRDRPHSQAENRSRQFLEYALTLPEDRTRKKWPGESPAIAISEITASAQYARSINPTTYSSTRKTRRCSSYYAICRAKSRLRPSYPSGWMRRRTYIFLR